jgi:mono/diheme cytochrome c family protein
MKAFYLTMIAGFISLLLTNVFAADQETQDLYKSRCQGCHGPAGKASVIGKKLGAKDFQDPGVIKMSRPELETIIKDGKNKMPPYKDKFTDDQIKALAKYIKEMK